MGIKDRIISDVLGSDVCAPCDSNDYECEAPALNRRERRIEVDEVLGVGQGTTTVEVRIPIIPPAFEVLVDLIDKNLIFDAVIASDCKVFINGRIIKDIPFKTSQAVAIPRNSNISRITLGNIRHVTVEIPFAMCIHVPEARRGMRAEVIKSKIDSVEFPTNTFNNRRLIRCLTEKDCIFVKVKVVRDTIICVPAVDC